MDIEFRGIHHVSLNVDDLAQAQTFYVDQLGMRLLDRPDLGFPGLWLDAGGQEIHLLAIESGVRAKEQHFALLVDNLNELIEQLHARGVGCSDPIHMEGICAQSFTRDPSGNLIEFNQRLS